MFPFTLAGTDVEGNIVRVAVSVRGTAEQLLDMYDININLPETFNPNVSMLASAERPATFPKEIHAINEQVLSLSPFYCFWGPYGCGCGG